MIPRMGRSQNPPRAGANRGLFGIGAHALRAGGTPGLDSATKTPLKALQRMVHPHAESEERVGIDQNRRKPPVGAVMQ